MDKPNFRRDRNGILILGDTKEATRIAACNRNRQCTALLPKDVHQKAVEAVKKAGGNTDNRLAVLGQYQIQFGNYKGQPFRWMPEHCLGYSAWLVNGLKGEKETETPLSKNKFAFKEYLQSYEEGIEAVAMKAEEKAKKVQLSNTQPVTRRAEDVKQRVATSSALLHALLPPAEARKMKRILNKPSVMPKIPVRSPAKPATETSPYIEELKDEELYAAAEQLESSFLSESAMASTSSTVINRDAASIDDTTRTVCDKPPAALEQTATLVDNSGAVCDKSKTTLEQTTTTGANSRTVFNRSTTPRERTATKKLSFDILEPAGQDVNLPDGWKQYIPKADQGWISRALFKLSSVGKAELDSNKATKLWFDPPQPPVRCSQPPRVDYYFTHRLLLWMPRRLWRVVFRCIQPQCDGQELISGGLYPVVRHVLDIDEYYLLATEKMACNKCTARYIAWSGAIVNQLDIGHSMQFPVLLTYRYACDIRVARLMRQRGLGNSSTQLEKKLREQHGESWYRKTLHYLTDCSAFVDANKSGLVVRPNFEEPPPPVPIPKYRWFMNVYCCDVLRRIKEVKSSITSTFGQVMKIDSTKKIVKKLAGHGAGTATWMTNVGNENGEILMSVLTSGEGCGLEPMVAGLLKRYSDAEVEPPSVLYVDRDCCGNNQMRRMFSGWPDLIIRLDVWHFMHRFISGCTTDSHQLYGTFMGRLSKCIFEWSSEDLEALKVAKRSEMLSQHVPNPSDEKIINSLTKKELALHCRRRTRGTEETTKLLQELLEAFTGDQGLDTLGVPLLDKGKIWEIWESQRRHVACLQDPPDFPLYSQTGTLKKGSVQLPTYRCSRGSTSLESFHLHLNRFIPGTSASDMHFQAYLLEGMVRWNQDRAEAATTISDGVARTYSGLLRHACNNLSTKVLSKQLIPEYTGPNKYTGESIGVDYLYAQTGKVLQDFTQDPDSEDAKQLETNDDAEDIDEGFDEQDDFDDMTVSLLRTTISSNLTTKPQHAPESKLDLLITSSPPTAAIITEGPPSPSSDHSDDTIIEESVPVPEPEPSTSSEPVTETHPEPEESVGPDNVGGFKQVEDLAEYLYSLHDQSMILTNEQASTVIRLWDNLALYDKRPAKLSPRYKTESPKGRFMRKKGTNVVEGVERTRRCFVGQLGEPAQWPNANRYMEQLIVRLCHLYPSPEKKKGKTTLRWTLVSRAYKKIREKVINNGLIKQSSCRIQLLEINSTTLSTWYNKRAKQLENQCLQQGIHLQAPPISATTALPVPKVVSIAPQPIQQPNSQFLFVLPPNTAGQANTRIIQTTPQHPVIMPSSGACPLTSKSLSESARQQNIPKTTLWYRKRQYDKTEAGASVKRYKRTSTVMKCSKCGMERDQVSHKQYYGSWWCAVKSEETYETWRTRLAETKKIQKKK